MYKNADELLEILNKKNFAKRLENLAKKYKNKKIIFYGAGIFFDTIEENFDLKKLNAIGIADIRFSEGETYKELPSIEPEKIAEKNPDIVLITAYETDLIEDYFEENLFEQTEKFKYEPILKFSLLDILKELFSKR